MLADCAEKIIELSPDSIVITAPDGTISGANRLTCELLGYDESEIIGRHFGEITALHIFSDKKFSELIGRGSITRTYVNYVTKSGERIPMQLTGKILTTPDGQPCANLIFAQDMRQVQDIIASLHLTRTFNENALSLIHTGFIALDSNKRILFCNPGFCQLVRQTDLIGDIITDVLSSDTLDEALERAFSQGEEIHNLVIKQPDIRHSPSDLVIKTSLVHFDAGKNLRIMRSSGVAKWQAKTHVLLVVDDITEQIRSQDLENERTSLRRSLAAFEKILGIVGHELRTPLAGLRATTELMQKMNTSPEPDFNQFLDSMHDEVIRMSESVNDLLEVARINSGTAKWTWTLASVERASNQAISTVRKIVKDTAVALNIEIKTYNVQITGDENAIYRLIVNLLTNAHKNTKKGHITITLSSGSEDGHDWLFIQVQDSGTGIPPAIVDKLGEAFALNSGVIGDGYIRGSGLGLAICKGIAAKHGGDISIRSVLGEGTTITVKLRTDLPGPIADGEDSNILRTEAL